MQKIQRTLAMALAATAIAFSLAGCKQDIRDVKISELTIAQQKEIRDNLKPEELELVQRYALGKTVKGYADLTVNQVIKVKDGNFPVADSK